MPTILANDEPLVALTQVKIPNNPAHSTIFRWATGRGARGTKLETVRIGGRLFTSDAAVARFLAACNGEQPAPAPKVTNKRRREIAAAERRVRAAGV